MKPGSSQPGPLWDRLYDDLAFWCETGISILDENRRPVQFVLNPVQLRLLHAEQVARSKGLHAMVILKARRHGVTTFQQAMALHECWRTENVNCLTLAHTDDATSRIFADQALYMYEHMPQFLKPERKGENARSLVFPRMRSVLDIATAGGKSPGRGGTLSRVHVSEAAFVERSLMANLRAGLQEAARTGWYVEESTANGSTGLFHATVTETMSAVLDRPAPGVWIGKNRWALVFLPWFLDARNAVPVDGTEPVVPCRPRAVDTLEQVDGEDRLVSIASTQYGMAIQPEQLLWRRQQMASAGKRSLRSQEYPETPEEAFIASGGSRFQASAVAAGLAACHQPLRTIENADGCEMVFAEPKDGHWYVVACDTSEGGTEGDGQYQSVHDGVTFEQAACWHGRVPPRAQGLRAADLAKRYNGALLGVERQNHGHAVIAIATGEGRCATLYVHDDDKLGWSTDPVTRPIMTDDLAEAVDSGALAGKIHDPEFWRECLTFEKQASGKYEAKAPAHDDRIMAVAQALQIRNRGGCEQAETWEEGFIA